MAIMHLFFGLIILWLLGSGFIHLMEAAESAAAKQKAALKDIRNSKKSQSS